MKKILWIILILIILFILFLWLNPKSTEQTNQDQSSQSASQETAALETEEPSSTSVPTTAAAPSDESSVQLNPYAAIQDAWLTAPPPGSRVSAVYMTISNSGRAATKITAVDSDDFDDMMFHQTVIEDGVASMQSIDSLDVPGAGSLTLQPQGLHIMAMDPERELKAGDKVTINFTFDDGQTYSATLPVR